MMYTNKPTLIFLIAVVIHATAGCFTNQAIDLTDRAQVMKALPMPSLDNPPEASFTVIDVTMGKIKFDDYDVAGKKAAGEVIAREIRSLGLFRFVPQSEFLLQLRIRLDPRDKTEPGWRFCLFLGTGSVFPATEDEINELHLDVYRQGQIIKSYHYSYVRIYYVSWLVLPFNLFISPFRDDFGMNPTNIPYREALINMRYMVRKDLIEIHHMIRKAQEMKGKTPEAPADRFPWR